jgi:tripartite-type tricarboxylate transporter receptor subunit TctC
MKLPRRTFLHLAAAATALPTMPRVASALDYPTRPVHLIVGYPPGGVTDIVARLIAPWLSERLGQSFVVENRPGASSNIATEAVARAPPEKRLARVLLLLANFGKEATIEPVIGKFSQETLAEMIGTTRSRVSFFMNKFRQLGYIEYNGKLEIRNSLLNVVLYDKPEIRKDDASNGPR